MTTEVREFLSRMVLDMSGQVSENSTPKRLNPVVIITPPPCKLGDPSRPVDTSSQVGTLDDAEMAEASLEEVPTASSPTAETPGPSSSALPTDTGHLWEEANKALGELLAMKSSINAQQQKLVWELGTQPSRKLRPPAPAPSKKPKPFAPWSSGMQRPKELPKLIHFTYHMLSPSSTWKKKPLRRRIRVSLTSYPPVKLPSKPALWNSMAHW